MAIKLYPPQLEGTLPAFYKTYNYDSGQAVLQGANILIPFGMNDAVSWQSVDGIQVRIRTIATNTFLIIKEVKAIDKNNLICNLELNAEEAKKLNEGQFYKLQIAFIDKVGIIGYYSTIGIIKCIAKPTVTIANFETWQTNQYNTEFIGEYQQDTTFGDSTEKVYSYSFTLWDSLDNIIVTSGEQIHDSTQDVSSFSSQDQFKTYTEIQEGSIGFVQYTVTTLNGLTISSPKYQVMKSVSVDLKKPINIITQANYENGYIQINFKGYYEPDELGVVHEAIYAGTFVITRGSDQDNWFEWEEVKRFVINSGYPSDYEFRDYTVQQGINYRYGLQQYNLNGVTSNKTLSLNLHQDGKLVAEPTKADFEDMFLYDGIRQLKIKFNPRVDSFKNTIPEQKIETIGSKYPFIFRNGQVCYKEFPIAGLISYQMDDATLFLNDEELQQAGIIEQEQIRKTSSFYNQDKIVGVESNYKVVAHLENIKDQLTGTTYKKITYTYEKKKNELSIFNKEIMVSCIYRGEVQTAAQLQLITNQSVGDIYTILEDSSNQIIATNTMGQIYMKDGPINAIWTGKEWKKFEDTVEILINYSSVVTESGAFKDNAYFVRTDKNLTSENIMGERFFKLKVLDWLSDGQVKLFRSPTEGNYLVRLLNVSMRPIDTLGRMLHEFSSTGYEIAELNYDNLIYYHIINNDTPNIIEPHWTSIDINPLIKARKKDDQWVNVPLEGAAVEGVELNGFAPGDLIRISFSDDIEGNDVIFTIGITGTFNYDYDDRTISKIEILPNINAYGDFDRNIIYKYPGILSTEFDAIKSINTHTQVAEEFVGPKTNLLANFDLMAIAQQYEDTSELQRIGLQKVKENIYNKDNINYNLGNKNKIHCLDVDILHVRKRDVIPIYACEGLDENLNVQQGTKFCVTPFNIGYVNDRIIINVDTIQKMSEALADLEHNTQLQISNILNDITLTEQEKSALIEELNQDFTRQLEYLLQHTSLSQIDNIRKVTVFDVIEASSISSNVKLDNLSFQNYLNIKISEFENELISLLQNYEQELVTISNNTQLTNEEKNKQINILTQQYNKKREPIYNKLNEMNYNNDILSLFPNERIFNSYDIQTLTSSEELQFYYYNENTLSMDSFLIFQVYVPKKFIDDETQQEFYDWVLNTQDGYKYYDTFTNKWWEGQEEYNPTFSINSVETECFIAKKTDCSSFSQTNQDGINNEASAINAYMDYELEQIIKLEDNNTYNFINPNEGSEFISLNEIEEITLRNLGNIERLVLGNGVIADVTCRLQVIDYLIEEDDLALKEARAAYKSVDELGNTIGAVGTMANEINNFMTKYTLIQEAKAAIAEKWNQHGINEDKKKEYDTAAQETIVLCNGAYKRLQDYCKQLYFDIQGEDLKHNGINTPKYQERLGEVFKYLTELQLIDDSNNLINFWIPFSLNNENSNTNSNIKNDYILIDNNDDFVYTYNKNGIQKRSYLPIDASDENSKKIIGDVLEEYNKRTITTLEDPDFTIFLDEKDSNGNYQNTVDDLKQQILMIAMDNKNIEEYGILYTLISLLSTILDKSQISATRQQAVISQINNNTELYEYVLVTVEEANSSGFLDKYDKIYYYDNDNDIFIDKKSEYIQNGNLLIRDVQAHKVYVNYITVNKYANWLLNKLINSDNGLDIRLYNLLHKYDSLPIQVCSLDILTKYRDIFFIGEIAADYNWMKVEQDNTYLDKYIYPKLDEDGKHPNTNLYCNNNGHGLFQGNIVNVYEQLLTNYIAYKEKEPIENEAYKKYYKYVTQYVKVEANHNYNTNLNYFIKNENNEYLELEDIAEEDFRIEKNKAQPNLYTRVINYTQVTGNFSQDISYYQYGGYASIQITEEEFNEEKIKEYPNLYIQDNNEYIQIDKTKKFDNNIIYYYKLDEYKYSLVNDITNSNFADRKNNLYIQTITSDYQQITELDEYNDQENYYEQKTIVNYNLIDPQISEEDFNNEKIKLSPNLYIKDNDTYIQIINSDIFDNLEQYYTKTEHIEYTLIDEMNQDIFDIEQNKGNFYYTPIEYSKALLWDEQDREIINYTNEYNYWKAVYEAGGIIEATDGTNNEYITDANSVTNLLEYAQQRMQYCNDAIIRLQEEKEKQKNDYNNYINMRNEYNTIHQETAELLATFQTALNNYQNLINEYQKLIIFMNNNDSDYDRDLTLLDLINKYNEIKDRPVLSPISNETTDKQITEQNNNYIKYKNYLNQMQYNISGSEAAQMVENFNNAVDLWNELKSLVLYYNNLDINKPGMIQILENKNIQLVNEIAELSKIANLLEDDQEFDEEQLINNIKDALANYFFTLGLTYLNKVERRFG